MNLKKYRLAANLQQSDIVAHIKATEPRFDVSLYSKIENALCLPTPTDFRAICELTAYCACKRCCGKTDGITASGVKAQDGVTVDATLQFGTRVYIEGIGWRTVQDTGSAIGDGDVDIYMSDHKSALDFGVKHLEVIVE